MTTTTGPSAPAPVTATGPASSGARSGRAGLRRRLRRLRRRIAAGAAVGWLRLTFVVLQAVAPAAADRKALDVWCTLPPGARRRRPDHRPGDGELVRLATARGGEAVAEVWGDGPVVYLVHGWGGWRGQLGAFVAPLVAAGHRVVAIDAPGHGDAGVGVMGRNRGTLVEIVDGLQAAHEHFGPAAGVVAHSLGSTAAGHAVREGLRADRLVLLSPNASLGRLLVWFAGTFWLRRRATAHLRRALEQITVRSIDDFDIVPMGADGALPPTLVVHDEDDQETSYAVGAAVAGTWPTARLLTTRGLGHYRILADPAVVQAAVAHVTGAARRAVS